jgi:SAM-dependent methyltransferase
VGDAIFNDPRLARVYDAIEGDRGDLEVYVEMVDELGARSVLDIGCGTGTFACMLAGRGIDVVGVDPAWPSLEIARAKPSADAVRWLHGDATTLPPLTVDAAFMTGNVAQVFLTDEDWAATLRGTWEALRPGGHLVFETRDPARRAWERWTPELTRSVLDVPGVGVVEDWGELTEVSGQFVTFRSTTVFRSDNLEIGSRSTLRFRDRPEIEDSLGAAGFQTVEIRDAPDRPGLEFVYLAVRPD